MRKSSVVNTPHRPCQTTRAMNSHALSRGGSTRDPPSFPRAAHLGSATVKPEVSRNLITHRVLAVERLNQKIISPAPSETRFGRPRGRRRCNSAMAESWSGAVLLDDPKRGGARNGSARRATVRIKKIEKTYRKNSKAIAIISWRSGNLQSRSSCSHECETWLKLSLPMPTFASCRYVARKSPVCIAPAIPHLCQSALCPDGLSGVVRRSFPFPFTSPSNP